MANTGIGKEAAEFATFFTGGEILKKIFSVIGTTIHEEGIKTLKTNIFGIGVTDEILTGDAFAIAVNELGVSVDDVIKVADVLAGYRLSVKNKLTNIIGRDEQELIKKIPTVENEKAITIESKTVANMRGARLILLMSKMSKGQIETFLKGIDATTTAMDRVKEGLDFIPKYLDGLDKTDKKKKAEQFRDKQKEKFETRIQKRR